MTDEVTVFVVAVGADSRTATGTDADTLVSANAVAALPSDAVPEAYTLYRQVSEEEAPGDFKLTLNNNCSYLCLIILMRPWNL